MKSTVETLEDNQVKLAVNVEEAELGDAVDAAFKRIAKEVRIPGFRPGKVPRKVLEARIGIAAARSDALQDAIPHFYSEAVAEHDVDVIDQPEIDITSGETEGDLVFDAVVAVRPVITVNGHGGLVATVPDIAADDEVIEERIDTLRLQFAEWESVDRAVEDGDKAIIDIATSSGGEAIEGLTAEDFAFEVGIGALVPEVDEHLRGAKIGDTFEFPATHPNDEDTTLDFAIVVKDVTAAVLPEADDAWADEASEFATVAELRADIEKNLTLNLKHEAESAFNRQVSEGLAALCEVDVRPSLVEAQMQSQIENMAMALQAQGMSIEQFLQMTGQDPEVWVESMREGGAEAAKVDLVLRAVASQEDLEASDADVEQELEDAAAQMERDVAEVRERFEASGQLASVRTDLSKRKAYEWVLDRVAITTESGATLERADLEHEHDDHEDHDHDEPEAASPSDAEAEAEAETGTGTDADPTDAAADADES